MSIIAKSLKKSKKDRKTNHFKIVNISVDSYNNIIFYLIIFIFIVVFVIILINIYFFLNREKLKECVYVDVKGMEIAFNKALKNLESKKDFSENQMKFLLKNNKLRIAQEKLVFISKIDKKLFFKYQGIINFKNGDLEGAKKVLEYYCSKYTCDEETLSYLSKIYFLQGNLDGALKVYDRVNCDIFEKYYNKAVIYEKLGIINESLNLYKKSYELVKDPLLKRRIFNKIFIIEHYESKYN